MTDYAALHREVDDMTRASARVIAPLVAGWVNPRSVLDVGCGNGVWLAAFRDLGCPVVRGIDGDYLDPSARAVPAGWFRPHDLTTPFDLGREFDLVVCLEVAEHLPAAGADGFVRTLVRHGPVVLFSAAVPGQGGWHHVNERWQSHWAAKFGRLGYVALDVVRPRVWADPAVAFWYAQNTFLFVRADALPDSPALAAEAADPPRWPLDLVHPELLRLKSLPPPPVPPPPPPGLRRLLTDLPAAVARAVRRRIAPTDRTPRG